MMTSPKLPCQQLKLQFVSLGATAWIFKIGENIALKYAMDNRQDKLLHENTIYDILESQQYSPYILQSLFRRPDANFLPYMPGGSLRQRVQRNQQLDGRGNVLSVLRVEPKSTINQWAAELASAISFLETLSLAHGDLRPENILLDHEDHVKLADFDSSARFGEPFFGNAPPWARLQGQEAGEQENTWGEHGARTEQFAFGSILYTLLRGHQPYEYSERGARVVENFQNMIFPELSDDRTDLIINKCWKGSYASLQDLEAETTELHDVASATCADVLDDHMLEMQRQHCRELYDALHLLDSCQDHVRGPASPYQPPELCLENH